MVVNIENCEATGFGVGEYSGSNLWNIKAGALNTNAASVTIDGEVLAIAGGAVISGADDAERNQALNEAVANGANEILVPAGEYTLPTSGFTSETVLKCAEGTVFKGSSSLSINGATVEGATFKNEGGNAVSGNINGTLKNCTFTGNNALRSCYAGETVVFENCVFDGNTYGVHFDSGTNDVVFKNCTFSGFNTFGSALTLLTFENCTFVGNGKSGYNGLNLWGSTKLINCEFTFDGSTGTEWIDFITEGKTYEFENCTVNSVAYTAENYKNYVDKISSSSNVAIKINGVDCAW